MSYNFARQAKQTVTFSLGRLEVNSHGLKFSVHGSMSWAKATEFDLPGYM